MQVEEYILACKYDIINIVKNAVNTMNRERMAKHSNANLANDYKDNLHEDLKTLCQENGFEYIRRNVSQKIVIDGVDIKVKLHNSLDKTKREIIDKNEHLQLRLGLPGYEKEQDKEHSWELGVELSSDRRKLLFIRLVDFNNKDVKIIYDHSLDKVVQLDVDSVGKNEKEIKNNFALKESTDIL